ncbi:MAG: PAS domain S-box protein [Myxococcales bacterium]|nr:PAS domain S-box protein [Myxococcales bacterium]
MAHIRDAIVVDDLAGRVVYCNDRFLEIFGLATRPADLRLEDYVAPAWRAQLRDRHERRVHGEAVPEEFEYEGVRSDGTRVWIATAVTTVRGPAGTPVGTQSVLRDVTDRKQIQVVLELLSTKLGRLRGAQFVNAVVRELAQAVEIDCAFVTRLVGDRLEMVGLFTDGEARAGLAFPLAGSPCEFAVGSDSAFVAEGVGARFPGAAWLRELGAESFAAVRLTDSKGKMLGTIAVAGRKPLRHVERVESVLRLFAVRTSAEMERVAIEAKLADLFEFSPDGQLMVDRHGVIVLANARAHEMFGYDPGTLVGRTVETLVREGGEGHHQRLREAFVHGARPRLMGAHGQPFLARRRDGTLFPTDISLGSVRTPEGLLALAAIRDVTARVKAEEAHHALEARLRQSQRLEAMGTLAGGIAHDFNNILTAIFANVDHALQELSANHPAAPALRDVTAAAGRASGLVRQILAFSRQESSERTRLALVTLVEEVARLLRASLPSGVVLTTAAAPDTPRVMADPTQLHQVLMNLGTNAWHALRDKRGRIHLSVDRLLVTDRTDATALPGEYARIRVEDDGVGMTPEVLERIFDPFFTTKPVGQGTGLGLAVVHGIVQEHGGTITVESTPNRGTVFSILLPSAAPASERPDEAQPVSSRRAHRGHVLYLDDDPLIVTAAIRLVRSLGFAVTGFVHPEEAIEAVQREPRRFDLIVTDLQMPTLSGLEVASRVSAIEGALPIVLVSGGTEWSEAELAARGIHGRLDKPYGLPELERALDEALTRARADQSSSSPM